MRRLPYELYGASALMAAAIALLMRAWRREHSSMQRVAHRVQDRVEAVAHRSA